MYKSHSCVVSSQLASLRSITPFSHSDAFAVTSGCLIFRENLWHGQNRGGKQCRVLSTRRTPHKQLPCGSCPVWLCGSMIGHASRTFGCEAMPVPLFSCQGSCQAVHLVPRSRWSLIHVGTISDEYSIVKQVG